MLDKDQENSSLSWTTGDQDQVSRVKYPEPRIEYLESSIDYTVSRNQYPGISIEYPISSISWR